MAKKLKNGTPVRVHDPRRVNAEYRNHLGIVNDHELLFGGVHSYKVKLNNGREVWFDEGELRALKNS